MSRNRALLLGLGIAVATAFAMLTAGLSQPAIWTAAITSLCATWWVLEPIPIPATSIIPFAAFPLAGILTHKQVASAYGHTMILLLLGGFMLSTAIEHSGAHRRLALGMVRLTGGGGRRLILGFMLASALCSMWISNTATTLMLLPIALAVTEAQDDSATAVPLLLGIAYAASIGGMATPIGTPPNVIFMGIYAEETGREISFLEWMRIGVPAVVVLLPIAWWLLTRKVRTTAIALLPPSGPWSSAEKRVLAVFLFTAMAWIFRAAPLGGWSGLGFSGAGDSTVALAAVVAMFLIPDGKGKHLLDWQTAQRIPWGLLLLFGGGIAISMAFKSSGLSAALGQALTGITDWPQTLLIAVICLSVTFLTEVTSNTATTSLLMPILIAAAAAAAVPATVLMIPATLSASCAFMLPVATAPNAIISGTGQVPTATMARQGILLNLIGAVAITVVCSLLL